MNEARVRNALNELSRAAEDLASMCDLDAPEHGGIWHAVASNATALQAKFTAEELAEFARGTALLFSYHPGSFSEVYVVRADPEEQMKANDEFDALKDRVSKHLAELRSAVTE